MIFNLFKSRPTLKELIPNGFIDIHSHILPGIDDGAKNVNESIKLIYEMKKLGFSKIIATPHSYPGLYNNTNESIIESYKLLKKNLNINIGIGYSSEYMIDKTLIEKINKKSLLTIKDKYVLIEMSFISAPINLKEIIFYLQLADYIPILAHPERYGFLFNDITNYFELKKMGCKFQINLLSTTGYYGKNVLKICDKLYENNLVNFVGSDIHSMRHIKAMSNKVEIKEIEKLSRSIESNFVFN